MSLVRVASASDLKSGEATTVEANGELIALYNVDGKFFATSNTCLHKGGPLGEGMLDGDVITCPWHGWRYNVKTGTNVVMPSVHVQTFKVVVKGSDVFVDVP